jgi:hypothetical protein
MRFLLVAGGIGIVFIIHGDGVEINRKEAGNLIAPILCP